MITRYTTAYCAIALMASPALAATDGSPGATSTGSFNVTLTVQPPSPVTVHLLGLDDFDFGTIQTSPTASTPVPSIKQYFCINRSDAPGGANIRLLQAGVPINGRTRLFGPGGSSVNMDVILRDPPSSSVSWLNNDFQVGSATSVPGCTAASGPGVANSFEIKPDNLPPNATSGVYSAAITVVVSLP